MAKNKIEVKEFEEAAFAKWLLGASGALGSVIPKQVEYLARYCGRLGARAVVHEAYYVERHFIDDFALYYSRMLNPPTNAVQRFHVFSTCFSDDDFSRMLESSMSSPQASDEVQAGLSREYLGFISIRPVPSAPVGRTVLRKMSDTTEVRRQIWATSLHDVHLANLNLKIDGLAFQQQDVAVGACATAALWSALSRVSRVEGMRAPTPAEITEAATRHLLPHGRNLPAAGGLIMPQLSEAIRCCGFAPEAVRADMCPEVFAVTLHTYLLSGIPVVIGLRGADEGHAVAAVGFQVDNTAHPLLEASVPVSSACLKKLYVHDDRLGPYARAFLDPFSHPQFGEGLLFKIENETWLVDSALAPAYPKLRLPVRSLIVLADLANDVIEKIVGPQAAPDVTVEFCYQRSGDYLSKLAGRGLGAECASFLRCIALSRWCAVIRWYLGEEILVDFIYDTTDILRGRPSLKADLLHGLVCMTPRLSP